MSQNNKIKEKDVLTLKWGTLKAWDFHNEKGKWKSLLEEYFKIGSSASAMMQRDTPRQKEIILELIDECKGEIWNDWEGIKLSKKKARDYINNYGKN